MAKYQFNYRLFHNSKAEKIAVVSLNKFKYDEIGEVPAFALARFAAKAKEMIQKFESDSEEEQRKYPYRYEEDYALELVALDFIK